MVVLPATARVEPSLIGSPHERLMERHNQAILDIARRHAGPIFHVNQEEDERRIECHKPDTNHYNACKQTSVNQSPATK
ncbi:hypothetical protein KIN20_000404, partial [Parelaphostrongylus tenuis]